jgi:hypothetical protein
MSYREQWYEADNPQDARFRSSILLKAAHPSHRYKKEKQSQLVRKEKSPRFGSIPTSSLDPPHISSLSLLCHAVHICLVLFITACQAHSPPHSSVTLSAECSAPNKTSWERPYLTTQINPSRLPSQSLSRYTALFFCIAPAPNSRSSSASPCEDVGHGTF